MTATGSALWCAGLDARQSGAAIKSEAATSRQAHQNGVTPSTPDGKTTRLHGLIVTRTIKFMRLTYLPKQKARFNRNGTARRPRSFDGFRPNFIHSP
jgi:hypothetical protein